MYLRKSSQRSGVSRRTYVSIAHNVWISSSRAADGRSRARPVRLVHLGELSQVDLAKARKLVDVLRELLPMTGHGCAADWVAHITARLRSLTPLLRTLVAHTPDPGEVRSAAELRELLREHLRDLLPPFRRDGSNEGSTPGCMEATCLGWR